MISMNYMYLNRFFSRKKIIDSILDENLDINLFKEELKKNYYVLEKEYRNEFFYKNTLFNKYVIGKYSLNTTAAFSEVIIGKSKADFLIINHNQGKIYEIKTDLDNLDRLINQLEDYYKVCSEVYVVTSEKNYYPVFKLIKELMPSVGIIVLTENVNLSIRKKAAKDDSALKHENLFKLLRKKEYEEIIFSNFGTLPDVKPVQQFKVLLSSFKQLNVKEAQKLVFKQLRKRMELENIQIILDLPMPFRWIVYSGHFTDKELYEIYIKLND